MTASAVNAHDAPRAATRVKLLGVPLDRVTAEEACHRIERALAEGRGGWVITPNLDILRRLVRLPEFAELCADADLRLADGMPLIWASRLQRTPLPERVAGSDFIFALCEMAARAGRRVFLLGGNPGAAETAAARLREQFPSLLPVGTSCPLFGFERDPAQMAAIVKDLQGTSPDVVFVGLGSPKQELLIKELRRVLPRAWFLGIGVTFSFVAGEVRRAPPWMRRVGLEWLHRLAQEPRRLAKRYLVHGVPFALRLLAASAWQGLTSRSGNLMKAY